MFRKKVGGVPLQWWIVLIFLLILMLKTYKVLPDPEYIDLIVPILTAVVTIGIMGYLLAQVHSFHGRISTIEAKLTTLENDTSEIKSSLQQVRDSVNQIKGKLSIG
jgi:hypothetical protein